MSNIDRFPKNVYEPKNVEINGYDYTYYRLNFSSLYDLYNYLNSNPEINSDVFRNLHSETRDSSFAGIAYDDAVQELVGAPRGEFKKFLKLSNNLGNNVSDYVQEYINVKAPGGGYIDIPAYCSGDPYCYKTARSIYTPKFIRMYVTLSYSWSTTKNQVLNRALIIAALVNAFEQAGYVVELNTFELSEFGNELVNININIKNNDETFNKASLFKTTCYVEFLRRILFRVLETSDVKKSSWQDTYGRTVGESFARKLLKLDDNDIYIDQPNSIGVWGDSIVDDFKSVLRDLELEDKIDVNKVANDFKREVKTLNKKIK